MFTANLVAGVAVLLSALANPGKADESYGAPPPNITTHLDRLVASYPDWIAAHDGSFLILRDGRRFPISDGRTNKSFGEMLERPDIDDMFFTLYPAGATPEQPVKNSDPGRVRFEPLFVAMYGDCNRNEVEGKLKSVNWLPRHAGGRVKITSVNGIDKALDAISQELDELPATMIRYLKPT